MISQSPHTIPEMCITFPWLRTPVATEPRRATIDLKNIVHEGDHDP